MENKIDVIEKIRVQLPGKDCGLCGVKTCSDFANIISIKPEEIEKCIHLNKNTVIKLPAEISAPMGHNCSGCGNSIAQGAVKWQDSLGRDFDFILDTFPNDPGPRETMLLHNPTLVKELDIKVGDILIGRPMGMSCGCPVTHCGYAMNVDARNGVVVWCVTGPLGPRAKGYKDVGYYSAQAYEGIVRESKVEIKIGMRYWFMPHRCMLQWRHSGLVNAINKGKENLQIRIEGLMIG
jgi:uncharacterized Fe-S cluster-containing protein